jgi:transcriptional regulator with XRE-family HTH domain
MNHKAHRERVGPALEEIRRMIEESGLSERKISIRAGLSPGYVTQLLTGKPDLKIWHLLAILDALRCRPAHFFKRVYGRSALEEIKTAKKAKSASMPELADWFVGPTRDLKARLANVEDVLEKIGSRLEENSATKKVPRKKRGRSRRTTTTRAKKVR